MTLLRRAPREVYRVYAEDEFSRERRAEPLDGCEPTGTRERDRAVVGAADAAAHGASMVLLASVGAVGGLVAIAGGAPVSHARRRAVASLLARRRSRASSTAAGAHRWRESLRSHAPDRVPRSEPRGAAWRAACAPSTRAAEQRACVRA